MATKTLVGYAKALAILAAEDTLNQWVDGQSYYLVTDDDGQESLVGYGENESSAVNNGNTSWFSPGFPSLHSFQDIDFGWLAAEFERMEAEAGCELESLDHIAGRPSLHDRARRLATCDDPPRGEDAIMVASILIRE